jgi:hypothetical protein
MGCSRMTRCERLEWTDSLPWLITPKYVAILLLYECHFAPLAGDPASQHPSSLNDQRKARRWLSLKTPRTLLRANKMYGWMRASAGPDMMKRSISFSSSSLEGLVE